MMLVPMAHHVYQMQPGEDILREAHRLSHFVCMNTEIAKMAPVNHCEDRETSAVCQDVDEYKLQGTYGAGKMGRSATRRNQGVF